MTDHPAANPARLDDSLTVRAARPDDLDPLAQAIYAICAADGDASVAITADDLASEWASSGFDPQQDTFLAQDGAGRVRGYLSLWNVQDYCEWSGDLYCPSGPAGAPVLAALLQAMGARLEQRLPLAAPGQRVFVRIAANSRDASGADVFVLAGYAPVRYYWRMEIELTQAPALAHFVAGLDLRPFKREIHAAAVWQARNAAFAENWGSHPLTFEAFSEIAFDHPGYDPTLWQVLWAGDEVAAFSINETRMDIGWVHILGVRPTWRRHGPGLALLQQSFAEFHRRGATTVGLGVDASNPTGATRLYQKAGMHTVSEFVLFEKELRPGGPVPPTP